HPGLVIVPVATGERPLGAFLAADGVLLGGQLFPPLLLGLLNLRLHRLLFLSGVCSFFAERCARAVQKRSRSPVAAAYAIAKRRARSRSDASGCIAFVACTASATSGFSLAAARVRGSG